CQLRPLPPELPLRTAALAEPLAVALHAISLAGDLRDARVLVSGAGPIGLLVLGGLQTHPTAAVTACDVAAAALERARGMGADRVVGVTTDRLEPGAYEVGVEASGGRAAVSAAAA